MLTGYSSPSRTLSLILLHLLISSMENNRLGFRGGKSIYAKPSHLSAPNDGDGSKQEK